jgi:hypothetical protein
MRLGSSDEKRLFTQNAGTTRYIEAGDKAFTFPRDVFDFKERNFELPERISAAEEMGNGGGQLEIIWLCIA